MVWSYDPGTEFLLHQEPIESLSSTRLLLPTIGPAVVVLNVNPYEELNLDAILGTTNQAKSNSTNTYQRRKTKNFGVWDREMIENLDDLGIRNADKNTTDHTKVICQRMPLEFRLFMDPNYPNRCNSICRKSTSSCRR
jgi:hypothetical protein